MESGRNRVVMFFIKNYAKIIYLEISLDWRGKHD